MTSKLSVRDLSVSGKRVFVRVDFNVPLKGGAITDDTRIQATLPTIQLLTSRGAAVVLASHLGRPKGQRSDELSLGPVAARLGQLLGHEVAFADDCVGAEVERQKAALAGGGVLLLQNLRFHAEEEGNDPDFAQRLAHGCDVFVNDAFGTAHRAHASTVGVTRFLDQAAAGLLMEKELQYLGRAVGEPGRPYVAILGGAKVSDKIPILKNLSQKADALIVGGGMAYTFLKARGDDVGDSLLEKERVDDAREIEAAVADRNARLLLPVDHVVAEELSADSATRVVEGDIPAGFKGLDIGPATVRAFSEEVAGARTILWNGPMGVFELEPFSKGTFAMARAVADSQAESIVGGGDSIAAIARSGVADRISHISTGGGASLEYLSGVELPGVSALTDAEGAGA